MWHKFSEIQRPLPIVHTKAAKNHWILVTTYWGQCCFKSVYHNSFWRKHLKLDSFRIYLSIFSLILQSLCSKETISASSRGHWFWDIFLVSNVKLIKIFNNYYKLILKDAIVRKKDFWIIISTLVTQCVVSFPSIKVNRCINFLTTDHMTQKVKN